MPVLQIWEQNKDEKISQNELPESESFGKGRCEGEEKGVTF